MSAPRPGPTGRRGAVAERSSPARLRAWLAAAMAALLVATYLCVQLTYASAHLPPRRYTVGVPGAPASAGWADFRLLSLERTTRWGTESFGETGAPDADTEWVVAHLEVTPRHVETYMLCSLSLVTTDGRSWEQSGPGSTTEGESCVPTGDDDPPPALGRPYPVVIGYEVPVADLDRVAGLALDRYRPGRYPLLRPPA